MGSCFDIKAFQLQQKNQKKMNLTLKQYIQVYQGARMVKSPKTQQTSVHSTQNDSEKIFYQKLISLKEILKNHLQDDKIFKYVEYELEELKKVFTKITRMSASRLSRNDIQFQKKYFRRNTEKSKMLIPQLAIHDESLDDIRTTNLCPSIMEKKVRKIKTEQPEIVKSPKDLESTVKKSSAADNMNIKISNKSASSLYSDTSSTLQKIPSNEYKTKITPAPFYFEKPEKQNKIDCNCIPPTLSKKCSYEDDQIRNTKKTMISHIQSRLYGVK